MPVDWSNSLVGQRTLPLVVGAVLSVVWLAGQPTQAHAQTPAGLPAEPTALLCTYEACLQRALHKSPLIAAAREGLPIYEGKLREAKSGYLPKLEVNVFSSVLPEQIDGTPGTNPLTDFNYLSLSPLVVSSVGLAQPLWTFGKLSTLNQMAREGVEVSKATVRAAEDELRYQLARAWWGLVLVGELREMIDEGLRLMHEQQTKLEKQRDTEDPDFNPSDLMRLKVLSADLEDKARQFHRSRLLAEDAVRVAVGERHEMPVRADGELVPVEFEVLPSAVYEELALANNPRLLAMRGGARVEVLQAELAADNLWPDVLLIARYASVYAPSRETTQDSVATNPNNSATSGVGITVRWNLDLFRNLAKLDQAQAKAAQARLAEQGEREKHRAEVRNLYRELVDAKAMIAVQDKAMRAARGWLTSEQQAYDDGLGEFPELVRALETYFRRRLAWADAIYQYQLAVAALSRAVSQDIARIPTKRLSHPPSRSAVR